MGDDDIDPAARPRRRRFDPEYKLEILRRYDELPEGEKGGLLRREGLYSSHIVEWRRARDAGALAALASQGRTPKRSAEQVELERLRRRSQRLEDELARTRAALDIMGKAVGRPAGCRPRVWHEIVAGPPVDVDSDWRWLARRKA